MSGSTSDGATRPAGPTFTAPGTLTPAVTDMWDRDRSWTLKTYLAHGGYRGLRRAKTMSQDELVGLVKASNLRGRGGPRGSRAARSPRRRCRRRRRRAR